MERGRFQRRPVRYPIFPSDLRRIYFRDRCFRLRIQFVNLFIKRREFSFLLRGRQLHNGRRILAVAVHSLFGNIVEIGVELVEFLLRDRIVFMIVALRASDS